MYDKFLHEKMGTFCRTKFPGRQNLRTRPPPNSDSAVYCPTCFSLRASCPNSFCSSPTRLQHHAPHGTPAVAIAAQSTAASSAGASPAAATARPKKCAGGVSEEEDEAGVVKGRSAARCRNGAYLKHAHRHTQRRRSIAAKRKRRRGDVRWKAGTERRPCHVMLRHAMSQTMTCGEIGSLRKSCIISAAGVGVGVGAFIDSWFDTIWHGALRLDSRARTNGQKTLAN